MKPCFDPSTTEVKQEGPCLQALPLARRSGVKGPLITQDSLGYVRPCFKKEEWEEKGREERKEEGRKAGRQAGRQR